MILLLVPKNVNIFYIENLGSGWLAEAHRNILARCLHSDAHSNNLTRELYFKNLLHYILYTVKKIFQGQRNRTIEIEATTTLLSAPSKVNSPSPQLMIPQAPIWHPHRNQKRTFKKIICSKPAVIRKPQCDDPRSFHVSIYLNGALSNSTV